MYIDSATAKHYTPFGAELKLTTTSLAEFRSSERRREFLVLGFYKHCTPPGWNSP
jgi:hypothetical protein